MRTPPARYRGSHRRPERRPGREIRGAEHERHARCGAPLHLLADRQNRECTLFSEPHDLGYAVVDGPHPFGSPIRLPEPFGLVLDTTGF